MADPLRNACVTAVREELDKYGLKSEAEVINNGHVEVRWEFNGQPRRTRTSATPSDCYAHLKALAKVKRILKDDGAQIPIKSNVYSLANALATPTPIPPPPPAPNERLAKLESDFEGIFEMLLEATTKVEALEAKLSSLRVTASFDDGTTVAAPAVVTPHTTIVAVRGGSQQDQVLMFMPPGAWIGRSELLETSSIPPASMGAVLNALKVKGLIERGLRGLWRRLPIEIPKAATG